MAPIRPISKHRALVEAYRSGPTAPACTEAFKVGIVVEDDGAAFTGVCGCGYPIAVRTADEALTALREHLTYRKSQ